jgi:hypothetical protein
MISGRVELELHAFLISNLAGGECQLCSPAALFSGRDMAIPKEHETWWPNCSPNSLEKEDQ